MACLEEPSFPAVFPPFVPDPIEVPPSTARRTGLARLRAWSRFIHLQEDLAQQHRAAQRLNDELATANDQLAIANAQLAEMALQDDLTLLPNRREAMRRLEEQWSVARR